MSPLRTLVALSLVAFTGGPRALGPTRPAAAPARDLPQVEERWRQPADRDSAIAVSLHAWIDDKLSQPRDVTVVVKNGVVIYRGSVDTLRDKNRLRDVARATNGVRAVINAVDLEPHERDDHDLDRDVRTALAGERAIRDQNDLVVRTDDGAVSLGGVVGSARKTVAAEDAAASVPGVRRVDDELIVLPDPHPSDEDLQGDIRHALADDPFWGDGITVTVKDGRVRLWGSVGTEAARARLTEVSRLPGVQAIETDGLTVDHAAIDLSRRPRSYAPPDDETLAEAVRTAIALERGDTSDVDVTVDGGVVTLSGTVADRDVALALDSLARAADGVHRVNDRLVSLAARPEAARDRAIEDVAATRVAAKTGYRTRIRVSRGVAVVDGAPRSKLAQSDIEDQLLRIPGVRKVVLLLDAPRTAG